MVQLVVSDFDKLVHLTDNLDIANIDYQLCVDVYDYGIETPYLIVDGVPLDYKRAIKYLEECKNG
jgi:hypothetical protein